MAENIRLGKRACHKARVGSLRGPAQAFGGVPCAAHNHRMLCGVLPHCVCQHIATAKKAAAKQHQ
ncbi:hypothetical protein SDC9_190768 [bioreactor metagenome]|uniref:Uncharacterized protein n=1 Tax=bioreactor metagenome TaxID=1076179 RepID=A0A645HYE6_9ZZZZ